MFYDKYQVADWLENASQTDGSNRCFSSAWPESPEAHIMHTHTASQPRLLNLHLIGPMRVTDARGQKLVVRGRKAQAILALTALGPQMQRSRVWLRDKLWSTSDEARSATSLRQSLFELRRDLGVAGQDALDITADTVALRPDKVWVDQHEVRRDASLFFKLGLTEDSALLEGFDIGDPEFEDWLQAARFDWADQAEELASARASRLLIPENASCAAEEPVRIALLRGVVHGADELSAHLSDQLIEQVIDNLRELMPLRVLDLRSRATPIDDLAESADAEFFCRMRALCVGRNVTLTFFLYRASQLSIEWSQSIQCSLEELQNRDSLLLLGFVSQNVDRLAKTLCSFIPAQGAEHAPQLAGFAAMNMLFRLEDDALTRAMTLLNKVEADHTNGLVAHSLPKALRAYAASFAVGENIGLLGTEDQQRLHNLVNTQLGDSPFNSISLACLGHVIGYVFREHELAGKVLERAVTLNPSQAFAWDHLALHKIYTGEYETALSYAQRATQLGAYSQISYTYDTTLAMASTLAGDYRRATLAGRSALQKQPRFKAAMRYLMVAQSASGQRDAAEMTRDRLLDLDPEFRDPEVQRLRFGLHDADDTHPILQLLPRLME